MDIAKKRHAVEIATIEKHRKLNRYTYAVARFEAYNIYSTLFFMIVVNRVYCVAAESHNYIILFF